MDLCCLADSSSLQQTVPTELQGWIQSIHDIRVVLWSWFSREVTCTVVTIKLGHCADKNNRLCHLKSTTKLKHREKCTSSFIMSKWKNLQTCDYTEGENLPTMSSCSSLDNVSKDYKTWQSDIWETSPMYYTSSFPFSDLVSTLAHPQLPDLNRFQSQCQWPYETAKVLLRPLHRFPQLGRGTARDRDWSVSYHGPVYRVPRWHSRACGLPSFSGWLWSPHYASPGQYQHWITFLPMHILPTPQVG